MRIFKKNKRWHIQGRKTTTHGPSLWIVIKWHLSAIFWLRRYLHKGTTLEIKLKNGVKTKVIGCIIFACIAFNGIAQSDTVQQAKPSNNLLYHSLEVSYIALNTADVMLTYKGIEKGARELNPFIRDIIENRPLFISIKATFTIGALALIRQLRKHDPKTAMVYLIGANLVYSLVVANNVRIVMRL